MVSVSAYDSVADELKAYIEASDHGFIQLAGPPIKKDCLSSFYKRHPSSAMVIKGWMCHGMKPGIRSFVTSYSHIFAIDATCIRVKEAVPSPSPSTVVVDDAENAYDDSEVVVKRKDLVAMMRLMHSLLASTKPPVL